MSGIAGLPGAPRVLHIHAGFAAGDPQAARAARIANALGGRLRHSVVAGADPAAALAPFAKGVPVETVTGFPPLSGLPTPGRLQKIARAMVDYHLVLTYGRGALDAALARTLFADLLSLPPLIHHEDGSDETARGRRGWRSQWGRRLALGRAAGLVVPTELMEAAALVAWQQPLGRVKLIRDGVALDRFAKPPKRDALPRLTKRAGERWIGCVAEAGAEASAEAGLAALVAALPRLDDSWHLVVTGPDAALAAVKAQSGGLVIEHRVHLVAALDDPAPLAQLADIVAITGGREPLPQRALAAMAAGKAVIGFETGELALSLAEENGAYVAAPGDAAALAAALERLGADEFLRRQAGNANRDRARAERGDAAMIAAYRRLYASAMKRETI